MRASEREKQGAQGKPLRASWMLPLPNAYASAAKRSFTASTPSKSCSPS